MKILKIALILILIAAVSAASWYYRPWSDYSPARMAVLEDPGQLAESFRSMGSIVPNKTVSKADTPSKFIEQLEPLNLEFEFDGVSKNLDQFLDESSTTGLIVLKDGVMRHEQYRNGGSRESLFTSWSVAKSFVATVIVMAQKDGLIESLDDKAEKYAPQYAGSDFGSSTLRSFA